MRSLHRLLRKKIAERTDKIPADYFAWMLLMLSDGLFIHQTIGNTQLDVSQFIKQTEDYLKDTL